MVYFNIIGLSSEAVVACLMLEVNFVRFLSFSCCKTAFSGIVQISEPVSMTAVVESPANVMGILLWSATI